MTAGGKILCLRGFEIGYYAVFTLKADEPTKYEPNELQKVKVFGARRKP